MILAFLPNACSFQPCSFQEIYHKTTLWKVFFFLFSKFKTWAHNWMKLSQIDFMIFLENESIEMNLHFQKRTCYTFPLKHWYWCCLQMSATWVGLEPRTCIFIDVISSLFLGVCWVSFQHHEEDRCLLIDTTDSWHPSVGVLLEARVVSVVH